MKLPRLLISSVIEILYRLAQAPDESGIFVRARPLPGTPSARSRINGFTILEILVATAIAVLLVTLLLSILQSVSTHYLRTQAGVTRMGDAAVALDQIVQDLEGYVTPNFPNAEALRYTPESVSSSTNAAWLTILTTATDKDDSDPVDFTGATRAVSFRIAFQNTISPRAPAEDPSYAIYRAIASAEHTFENITPATTNLQTQYWNSVAQSPAPAPASPTAIENFLAENVVALTVRFQRKDNNQWTADSDTIRVGRDGATVNGVRVPGGFRRAEVSVTVLSPEGAQHLREGIMPLPETISRYGHTYVRQTSHF